MLSKYQGNQGSEYQLYENTAAMNPNYEEWFRLGELEHDTKCIMAPCVKA